MTRHLPLVDLLVGHAPAEVVGIEGPADDKLQDEDVVGTLVVSADTRGHVRAKTVKAERR